MGLRCLLGHDFGEPETERERSEEGNEVVVTVREVKTCRRCGEKRVVSENKEIKSIEQLRDTADEAAGNDASVGAEFDDEVGTAVEPRSGPESGQSAAGGPDVEGTEPEQAQTELSPGDIIDDAETDEPAAAATDADLEGEDEEADDMPVHPAQRGDEDDTEEETGEDDAVILDEDAPDEERGQWSEEADPDEVAAAGSDEDAAAAEASSDDEDAVIMDESGEPEDEELSEPTTPDEEEEDEGGIIMGEDTSEAEGGTAEDEAPTDEDGYTPWPEQEGVDEGHDAEAPDGESADVDFGGGIAPDSDEAAKNGAVSESQPATNESDAQSAARGTPRDGSQSESQADSRDEGDESVESESPSQPSTTIDLGESRREANLEYHCPECGLTHAVGNSSMRAGDICPACHEGYIEERERTETNQ